MFKGLEAHKRKKWSARFNQKFEKIKNINYDECHLYDDELQRINLKSRWKHREKLVDFIRETLSHSYPTVTENNFRREISEMIIKEMDDDFIFKKPAFFIASLGYFGKIMLNKPYKAFGFGMISTWFIFNMDEIYYNYKFILRSDRIFQLFQIGIVLFKLVY